MIIVVVGGCDDSIVNVLIFNVKLLLIFISTYHGSNIWLRMLAIRLLSF